MSARSIGLRIESDDFPCDGAQVRELHGTERISRLFEFELLVVYPPDEELDPRSVAGSDAAIVFHTADAELRRIHGMIAEVVDLLDTESELSTYRLRFVPHAHRMRFVRTQEIYMRLGLHEIIEQKLALVGLEEEVRFSLVGKDDPREFVVQFDETDLDFVSRLTEHVGWSYVFDHTGESDRLVFTDHNDGFLSREGAQSVTFQRRGEETDIYKLEVAARLVPAMYAVCDFNYMTPQVDVSGMCELAAGYAGGVVEYGPNFRTPEEGKALAQIRAEERQAETLVFRGEAAICTLSAGSRIVLNGHPRFEGLALLVTSVEHEAHQVTFGSGSKAGEPNYKAVFEAIPASTPYRPQRVTARPRIKGVMSGIIEADPGVETEQAWIDDQGRYLVRMLFDTAPPGERKASLPIRMAQPHSGPGYGVHMPLRPGTEVLITFIGGDPDRPVIVGSVPNALTPTPVVDREANMHRIRTWSGVQIEIDDGG